MALLHNRVSQAELKAIMLAENTQRTTLSFYHYFPVANPQAFRDELYQHLRELRVFGRIYVAAEGINAQVSIPAHNLEALKNYLHSVPPLSGIRLNIAVDDDGKSFWVLKIKVRDKIVADGITDPAFSMKTRGRYLNAEDFNNLTTNPETVVVDMRNHYEYEVGHFDGAIEVPSDTFRDQLPMAADMLKEKKESPIIMYCTGGIRCEKASAYLLHQGFKNVYHLEGGIINYVAQAKEAGLPVKFRGKNFVFDNRMGERVTEEIIAACHQCGAPADTHVNCANEACHLLFIQCEDCKNRWQGCCSHACFEVVQLPEEVQAERRKGVEKNGANFNKSKARLRPKLPAPQQWPGAEEMSDSDNIGL